MLNIKGSNPVALAALVVVFMFESFADRLPVLGMAEFLWVETGEVVSFPLVVE